MYWLAEHVMELVQSWQKLEECSMPVHKLATGMKVVPGIQLAPVRQGLHTLVSVLAELEQSEKM